MRDEHTIAMHDDAAVTETAGARRRHVRIEVHNSRPVAASSAMTRSFGVVAYSTPSMTIGFDCISEPGNSSCVSYVHATFSCARSPV